MRKGWKQKTLKEKACDLEFTRWYLIAPSGNRYMFYRGCYFPTIFVPTTYYALSVEDKTEIKDDNQLKPFRYPTGKQTKHRTYTSLLDNKTYEYDFEVDDRYQQALKFIYKTEDMGGFPEQKLINKYLENNKEMLFLFSQPENKIEYNSMPW